MHHKLTFLRISFNGSKDNITRVKIKDFLKSPWSAILPYSLKVISLLTVQQRYSSIHHLMSKRTLSFREISFLERIVADRDFDKGKRYWQNQFLSELFLDFTLKALRQTERAHSSHVKSKYSHVSNSDFVSNSGTVSCIL